MQDLIRRAVVRGFQLRVLAPYWFGLALLTAGLYGLLMSTAIREYQTPLQRAYVSGAFYWAGALRYELALFNAHHGRWPDAEYVLHDGAVMSNFEKYHISKVQIKRGSFNLLLENQLLRHDPNAEPLGNLSFMMHTAADPYPATAVWSCGWAEPLPQQTATSLPNLTDIDAAYLPAICRSWKQ